MNVTKAERKNHAWFALADAEACRLLSCSLTQRGMPHVVEHDMIRHTAAIHEHARPMTNAGMTHDVEEEERRFAGEIIKWLQGQAGVNKIEELVLFAPPRMLGVLRMAPLGSLKGRVEEIKGDLMPLNAGQLAEHPMIRELIGTARES